MGPTGLSTSILMSNSPQTHTLESLLEYEPFVRKVLRNMVVGEDQLDDLVQETWVRVMRRPPETRQGVRGWLATVARNLARDVKRGSRNREARERYAAREEAVHSVQSTNERLELHQQLVQAVLTLDEPYKSVVVLSYYEGLTPAQVAKKLERKETTVRSQLHRAHGQLKHKLDGEFGDRKAWMMIGVPWILSKEGGEGLGATGTTGSALGTGTWLAALAASVVVLAIWSPWKSASTGSESDPSLAPLENVGVLDFGFDPPNVNEPLWTPKVVDRAVQQGAQTPAIDPDTGSALKVPVTSQGVPVPNAKVWAFTPVMRAPDGFVSTDAFADWELIRNYPARLTEIGLNKANPTRSTEQGFATVEVTGGNVLIYAETPEQFGVITVRNVPERIKENLRIDLPTVFDRGATVIVTDPVGNPLSGVPVELMAVKGDNEWHPIDSRTSSGPGGEVHFHWFRTTFATHRFAVRARVIGRENPLVELHAERDTQPYLLQVEPYGTLHWSMEARPDKEFLGSAWLQLIDDSGTSLSTKTWQAARGHQGTWPCVALNVDLHMRFESIEAGLELEWQGPGPQIPGQHVTANVAVTNPCIVRGRFIGPANHGQANSIAPRFFYTFFCLNSRREVLNQVRFFIEENGDFEVALPRMTDPLSTIEAEIVGMWPTNQVNERIRVRLPRKSWGVPGTIELGEIRAQTVPHSILGRLIDEKGNPLANVSVLAQSDHNGDPVSSPSQVDGRFALNGLWADRVPLIVPTGQDWYLPKATSWDSSFDPITLTLHPTGHIEGRIQDALGSEKILCTGEDELNPFETEVAVESTGEYRIHGLPPGLYRLRLADQESAERVQVYEGQVSRAGTLQ